MSKLKRQKDKNTIQKNFNYSACMANACKVLISFEYLTDEPKYNLGALSNGKDDARLMKSFIDSVKFICNNTWEVLNQLKKDHGFEWVTLDIFNTSFCNKLKHNLSLDDTVYVYRFNGEKSRLIFKRGTQCRRVAQLLAVERNLGDAYNHGS